MVSLVPSAFRPPFLAVCLVSLTALAYELLLIRMFSIIQFHHFASMVISLALLGYGASGTIFSLFRERLLNNFSRVYLGCLVLFAMSALLCFFLAQRIPFHAEALIWEPRQLPALLAIYLLLSLPFFFAALSTALALACFSAQVGRLYGMDLLGAGLGSLLLIGLLFLFFPERVLLLLVSLAFCAGGLAALELGSRSGLPLIFILAALLVQALPSQWGAPRLSPYKELSQAQRIKGTQVLARRSNPLGLLTVMASKEVPWRHAPGLSLTATSELPPQLAIFTDGGGMTVINRYEGDRQTLAFTDHLTSALPYHLIKPQKVLVLGAGGGSEVLQALFHGVFDITAVELNPQMRELVDHEFAAFSGGLFSLPPVRSHLAEARGFVTASSEQYDLIQLSLLDSFGAATAGLSALSESYLYTVEALAEYYDHLIPGGYLVLSRWLRLPPRDSLKLFASALAALKNKGIAMPEKSLLLIRGLQTTTLLLKRGEFFKEEIEQAGLFSATRSFDLCYYAGMPAHEANSFNVLEEPYFYNGTMALAGPDAAEYMERYKFNLTPASDERPFFMDFLKLRTLAEIFALRERGGVSLLEWGYLVLLATLVQAFLASTILILLPLFFFRRQRQALRSASRVRVSRVFCYFFSLGLGFLFLEIAMLQRFLLFLHHPLYAAAVVICAFLFFAGLGSMLSQHLRVRYGGVKVMRLSVAGLVVVCLAYTAGLAHLFHSAQGWPVWAKGVFALFLIAPMGVAMGMPFPLALAKLGELEAGLIPWAWGVNGCASVLSAVLASLLAIHFGFSVVILMSLCLYGLATLTFPQERVEREGLLRGEI